MTAKPEYVLPSPDRVSELVRDFAQPLLYIDPAGPADIDTIRTAMMLSMICWNLPVYEATGNPLYAHGKRTLAEVAQAVPSAVAAQLRVLVRERKASYPELPFLVSVEVTGSSPESARIVAKAAMP